MKYTQRRVCSAAVCRLAAYGLAALMAACGAQSNGTDNGGRTHWLRSCSEDSECGSGVCWEQRCSVECSVQSDCAFASDAVCAAGHCEPVASSASTPQASQPPPTTAMASSAPASRDAGGEVSPAPEGGTSAPVPEAGIWVNARLDAGPTESLVFAEEVTAYTRDPNNRTLISLVATKAEWGSITLNLVNNPGPVSAGPYSCASGSTLVSATMLTDTGILSLNSDDPNAGCEIVVVEPGEQVGAPVSGTFNATLVSASGSVLTITDGGFRGVLND